MNDTMYQATDGLMKVRMQHVVFTKLIKGGEKLTHQARLITYVDERNDNGRTEQCEALTSFIGQQ